MNVRAAHIPNPATLGLSEQISALLKGSTAVFALIAAYIVLAPNVHILPDTELYNEKRLLQLGVFLATALAYFSSFQLRKGILQIIAEIPSVVRAALCIVAFLGAVSASQAAIPSYAFLEMGHIVMLFFTLLALVHFCRQHSRNCSKVIVGIIAISVFLYSLKFLVGYIDHLTGGVVLLWPEGAIGFDNIRFFNQFQTWTLPVMAAAPVLLISRSRLLNGALYGLTAVWWMLLLASGGRGVGLAMVAAAVGAAILFGRSAWPWLKRQAATLVGGGMLFFLFFHVFTAAGSSIFQRDLAGGSRPEAWGDAFQMMMQAPFLGVGPMHYAHFPEGALWAHPHNGILQWGAEWGLPSLLVVLVCLTYAFWMLVERHNPSDGAIEGGPEARAQLLRVTIVATLLAGAAHTLVSGTNVMPLSQMLLVLMGAWAWGVCKGEKSTCRASYSAANHSILIVGIGLAVLAVAMPVSKDAPTLHVDRSKFIQEQEATRLYPRYWQQGYFGY